MLMANRTHMCGLFSLLPPLIPTPSLCAIQQYTRTLISRRANVFIYAHQARASRPSISTICLPSRFNAAPRPRTKSRGRAWKREIEVATEQTGSYNNNLFGCSANSREE